MKVLQCINSLSAGGAEVFASSLAVSLKKLGCEIELFTYSGTLDAKGHELERALADAGIPHRTPALHKNWLKPLAPFHLAKAIADFKPDICHSHLEQSDLFLRLGSALASPRPKLARTIHSVYARAPSTPPSPAARPPGCSIRISGPTTASSTTVSTCRASRHDRTPRTSGSRWRYRRGRDCC
jgi:hypothetical protein